METICAISNVGPDAEGFIYIGIADKLEDVDCITQIYGIVPEKFDHVLIVGVDRKARHQRLTLNSYVRKIEYGITQSKITELLKTGVQLGLDVITFRNMSIIHIRIPRQSATSFLGDECFMRVNSSTKKATGSIIPSFRIG